MKRACFECEGEEDVHDLGCPSRVADSVRRARHGEVGREMVECPACGTDVAHVYVGDVGHVGLHPAGDGSCPGSFEETVMRGYLGLCAA